MFRFQCISPLILMFIAFSGNPCSGTNTISEAKSLSPGQTLRSNGGKFELGFFSPFPENTSSKYIGIWYSSIPIQTVVWVANRGAPIRNAYSNNSQLQLVGGNLNLYDGSELIWSAKASNITEGVLLDSGNFVLKNASGPIWQSFDYPTDTWLPGGKLGYSKISDAESRLISWKNPSDPASGLVSLGMDPKGNGAELFMLRNSSQIWRSGAWQDGQIPSFGPAFNFSYTSRDDGVYFTYNVANESILSRIQLGSEGVLRVWVWATNAWVLIYLSPRNFCQQYNRCGANAICDTATSPACSCLTSFEPKSAIAWYTGDFSDGCERRLSQCGGKDAGYLKFTGISLPVNPVLLPVGIQICEFACSVNCSCNAYAYSSKTGCVIFEELLDLQRVPNQALDTTDLYVKMNASDIADSTRKGNKHVLTLAIALPIAAAIFICGSCFCSCYIFRKRKRKDSKPERSHQNLLQLELSTNSPTHNPAKSHREQGEKIEYELPIFSFSSIVAATNDFSISNKLGEGGFGPVYKAELANGQFVAVKRLSERSGQGLEEFRNETELFAKLQHRNLVGILGCCIEQDEKILVYEYMPNKSLDFFLFGQKKQKLLDFGTRVGIIEGIAQGLLYLHQYSRFRIVHRDLKASNILLDSDMNPKISDFGMARIFGGNKVQANTNRIVGTYGYMSPEYAMEGLFSIKSDVFAFGVLLLEVMSGKKNTGFYGSDCLSLLGHAWNLWCNDRAMELVDSRLEIPSSLPSAPVKYIHVGLLCVQESPADRPTMVDVVGMLNGEQAGFVLPRHPAFTVGRSLVSSNSEKGKLENLSVNGLTVSLAEAR